MAITSAQAIYGLNAAGFPTSPTTSGAIQLGPSQTRLALTEATVGYSVRVTITAGDTVILDPLTNDQTGSTLDPGAAATATLDPTGTNNAILLTADESGVTGNLLTAEINLISGTTDMTAVREGNDITLTVGDAATIIITGTGDPAPASRLFFVTQTENETIYTSDGQIEQPLTGLWTYYQYGILEEEHQLLIYEDNTEIGRFSALGSAGPPVDVQLDPVSEESSGSPILNAAPATAGDVIDLVNLSDIGVTASNAPGNNGTGTVATVTETVFSGGLNASTIYGGDGKDWEGKPLAAIGEIQGIILQCASGDLAWEVDGVALPGVVSGEVQLFAATAGIPDLGEEMEFSTTANADFTLTVFGTPA